MHITVLLAAAAACAIVVPLIIAGSIPPRRPTHPAAHPHPQPYAYPPQQPAPVIVRVERIEYVWHPPPWPQQPHPPIIDITDTSTIR